MIIISPKERETLGAKIRKAREAKKISQSILGTRVGQSQTIIGQIERGELFRFPPNLKQAIFDVLKIED